MMIAAMIDLNLFLFAVLYEYLFYHNPIFYAIRKLYSYNSVGKILT